MIDHTRYKTDNTQLINILFKKTEKEFTLEKSDKHWRSVHQFNNKKGIIIRLQYNRFGEYDKAFIDFSPHKLFNNNLHNANFFTLNQAQESIIKTFQSLGIEKEYLNYFAITKIEIGVNFKVNRNAYVFLNPALMFSNYFFVNKYPNYKEARQTNEDEKYLKAKFYIKSEQRKTELNKTNYELGYCDENIMRFEIKLEDISKFKFLDFKNAESLFSEQTEEILQNYLIEKSDEIFFFSINHLNTRQFKNTQSKNLGQWKVKSYWKTLATAKRNYQKKLYNSYSKKIDLKKEIKECIIESFRNIKESQKTLKNDVKKCAIFPPKISDMKNNETILNSDDGNRFLYSDTYIDVGKSINYYREKRYCKVTGLNITMQKIDSEFMCTSGLNWYIENEPETYHKLCEKYLTIKKRNIDLETQVYYIAHNIRNKYHNKIHNRKKFEQRNYKVNQLQFRF